MARSPVPWWRSGSPCPIGAWTLRRRIRHGRWRRRLRTGLGADDPSRTVAAHLRARRCLRAQRRDPRADQLHRCRTTPWSLVSQPESDQFGELDVLFEELRSAAKPSLKQDTEDEVVPRLVSAALRSWISEIGDDNMEWMCEAGNGGDNELHAWLRHTVDETSDLVEHWGFRAISAPNPIAALTRLRKARSAAGLSRGADNRHLIVYPQRGLVEGGEDPAGTGGVHGCRGEVVQAPRCGCEDVLGAGPDAGQGRHGIAEVAGGAAAGQSVRVVVGRVAGGAGRAAGGRESAAAGCGRDHARYRDRDRGAGADRAGVVAEARDDLRGVGEREDGAAAQDRGGVCAAGRVGDRAGPEQRSGPDGGCLAGERRQGGGRATESGRAIPGRTPRSWCGRREGRADGR